MKQGQVKQGQVQVQQGPRLFIVDINKLFIFIYLVIDI
jgi:hypothetical protein